jgi:hypothetical protein
MTFFLLDDMLPQNSRGLKTATATTSSVRVVTASGNEWQAAQIFHEKS